ncbi:MAG: quaternary amine ABC transporter ATP-binding protein [Alphaproteobacteria bacterium]
MAIIEIRGVTKIFGRHPEAALAQLLAGSGREALLADTNHTVALQDVSLTIDKGQIFVVMGLSGSGKSTLIRHLNRLIDPTAGSIIVDEVDVTKLSIAELISFRRDRMAMVFQHFALLPHKTVIDNIAYGLELQGTRRNERRKKAQEWVDAVGLAGFERQYPAQLSGGMRQRVGLARALCVDANILLMDEAFSALDPLIRSQMQDLLMELQARLRKTIVFITHDLDEALRLGDQIAILRDGEVVQVGAPAEILLEPADDYVRAFVKDVNRSRVLTVETVMQPPLLRLSNETPERALVEMQKSGAGFGYVVAGSTFRGLVTKEGLGSLGEKASDLSDAIEDAITIAADATLAEALPKALASIHPIAVVDGEGALKGVLSAKALAEVLNPSDATEDAAIAERNLTVSAPT